MGITVFAYAVRGTLSDVEASLRRLWPEDVGPLEAAGSKELAMDALDNGAAIALWQDGPYVAFVEQEVGLADDDEILARWSATAGDVIAVVHADHGGDHSFYRYSGGHLVEHGDDDWSPDASSVAWRNAGLVDFLEASATRILAE